jgi:hypothetical protein
VRAIYFRIIEFITSKSLSIGHQAKAALRNIVNWVNSSQLLRPFRWSASHNRATASSAVFPVSFNSAPRLQHSVRVKYDEHQEFDMAEDRYRARGYQPPFDELPWRDEGANDNA